MIDRQFGMLIIACDSEGCREFVQGKTKDDEFEDVWQRAKHEGWHARKIAGEWLHGCPFCGPPT